MRVAILASYPVQRYAAELGIDPKAVKRVTTWNETLVEGLRAQDDMEILVVTGSPAVDGKKVVRDGNVTVVYLPLHHRIHKLSLFYYTRYITRKLLREFRPDVVHGIGTEHIWPYIAVSYDCPHLVTLHGLLSVFNRQAPPKKWYSQRVYFGWLEQRLLPRIKDLISINPYVVETFGQSLNARIHYIENPIRESFREIEATPGEGRYALFVGSVSPRKGIDTLVEALNAIKQRDQGAVPVCKLVGPFSSPEFEARLKERIAACGLEDHVEFLGFKVPTELVDLYRSAAFLVLPSLAETAPMCIAESLSAGVPVIATDVGGVKHMIEDGETGFIVSPSDVAGLSEKMEFLWKDAELRARMGGNAKSAAEKRWSPAMVAQQTLAAYQEVMSRQ